MERYDLGNALIREASLGVKRLKWLAQAIGANPKELVTYSEADFEWLTRWLQMFNDPKNYGAVEMAVTESDLAEYERSSGRKKDLGYLVKRADDGGVACWRDVMLWDEDPLSEDMLMNCLKHQWLAELAETLVKFIAGLTPEQAARMKPKVLERLIDLSGELIRLDKVNEDESQPFEARLNPQINLFGDTSYDVLTDRLAAGLEAWKETHAGTETQPVGSCIDPMVARVLVPGYGKEWVV